MSADAEDSRSLPPFASGFLDRVSTGCIPRVESATVPILGVQDEIVHDRTGVLYRVGDRRFVLTAAHKLRAIIEHEVPLYLSLNAEDKLPLPLAEAVFHTTEDDGRDVAAISLPTEMASEIEAHREFVRHNEVSLHESTPGLYLFLGYPMVWSGIVISESTVYSRPLAFLCREYAGESSPNACHDDAVHLRLEFDQEAFSVTENAKEILPRIGGISGCGIWRIADWSTEGFRRWSPAELRLVGIQHSWSEDQGYIRGTKVGYILSRILEEYPDVEPAMNIMYPRTREG